MKDFIKQDYKEFKASDFALERSFIEWVRNTDQEAVKFWTEWVRNNPHKAEEIELARSLVVALQFRETEVAVAQINTEWKKLQKRSDHTPVYSRQSRGSVINLKTMVAVAATLLLIATFTFIIRSVHNQDFTFENKPLTLTKETPKGQKLFIVLPDGSEIKLNSDSKISFPEKFTGKYREVILEGEAFFDVVHHEEMPFKVRIGEFSVEVLGTSFNVEAYPETPDVRVALVSGKVKVNIPKDSTGTEEIFLNPSEMVGLDRKNLTHHIRNFDPEEIVGWKDGYLFFRKVNFEQTVAKLERWYGVDIEIAPSVKIDPDWRFNGKFQNKSLDYILRAFSYPDLFRYQMEENKVIIY